ncbi:MAG: biopolymer transporter ExbD [Thiofilum sp.]|uniref:ExbD/TolR family protein n=1 Tax=Thiofilum sp. TaxID=2212733 RepID=UPI0025F8D231|nr:biopolymer transporter ExbD [Thiofilum sp.]MBK8452351.1 biopolymer transporter ExbD [Thiofilum sp.]
MRRPRKVMAQMNVVPYIDVMLVLLVIFMITAPMMKTGVEVNAPEADAKPLTTNNQQEPLIVTVDRSGQYFIEGDTPMSLEQITQFIQTKVLEAAERPVYVKGDGRVEYQYLMQAMVAVQKAGAKKIGLMADPERNP